jgi:hypothetical protein
LVFGNDGEKSFEGMREMILYLEEEGKTFSKEMREITI